MIQAGLHGVNSFTTNISFLVSQKIVQRLFPPLPHPCNSCKFNSVDICTASQFQVLNLELPGSTNVNTVIHSVKKCSIVIRSVKKCLLRNLPGSVSCDLSWLHVRKIMKDTDLCKPASPNCPMGAHVTSCVQYNQLTSLGCYFWPGNRLARFHSPTTQQSCHFDIHQLHHHNLKMWPSPTHNDSVENCDLQLANRAKCLVMTQDVDPPLTRELWPLCDLDLDKRAATFVCPWPTCRRLILAWSCSWWTEVLYCTQMPFSKLRRMWKVLGFTIIMFEKSTCTHRRRTH